MAATENQKLKTLYIMQLLEQETDENNGVTMGRIIEFLASKGIAAERKSVYSDIEVLRSFGLDIAARRGRGTEYMLLSRSFELPELKLLVDAVSASRFITEKKSRALIKKLEALASRSEARELSRQVIVGSRVKSMNESIFYTVDAVHSAINKKKTLLFRYFDYDRNLSKIYRHDGADYEVTPLALIYSGENYYLAAYNPARESVVNFRADRMANVRASRHEAESNDVTKAFSASGYAEAQFSMYSGEKRKVTVWFDDSLTTVVIDRFGTDIILVPAGDGGFTLSIEVEVSPVFYSWIFMFGERAAIVSPEDAKEEFSLMAERAAKQRR